MSKTIIFFVIAIAVVGFLVYKYVVEEEDCPRTPSGQCMGTTTGYEGGPTVRDGGGRGGGGGNEPIQVQVP
jgi:hypothetical protein